MATAPLVCTLLAPGQRYAEPGGHTWRPDRQVTIARLERDRLGLAQVTFRCPNGDELTLYAAQVEAAIADGQLAPIVDHGQSAPC